jgi:hypothetical protein
MIDTFIVAQTKIRCSFRLSSTAISWLNLRPPGASEPRGTVLF